MKGRGSVHGLEGETSTISLERLKTLDRANSGSNMGWTERVCEEGGERD